MHTISTSSLTGINQIQTQDKIGLNFAKILRAILRQDPDIIMIGEIRDAETANIAINAAETGHLVLATLHTTGVAQAINRLINMGVANYLIADNLSLDISLDTSLDISSDTVPEEVMRIDMVIYQRFMQVRNTKIKQR